MKSPTLAILASLLCYPTLGLTQQSAPASAPIQLPITKKASSQETPIKPTGPAKSATDGGTEVVEVTVGEAPPAGEAGAAGATPQDPQAAAATMGADDDGYRLKDAALNDVFQFLAQKAGKQYFHNANLVGPGFLVTGNLNDGDPVEQMDELAFMYNVELFHKGNTIYALNASQVNQLPQEDFAYQLRYLRPTDIDQIKGLIQPVLTPGTGLVNFEPKTNTLLIMDSTKRIEAVKALLEKIDQPKGQVIVETKILRVTNTIGSKVGVDWTTTLGDGLTFDAQQSLNAMFNLPDLNNATRVITETNDTLDAIGAGADPTGSSSSERNEETVFTRNRVQGSGLVLSPVEVSAVLKLLNTGNLAEQKSNPTIITEDNETASVAIIDRVPIITATSTLQNDVIQVTEEVRYRIDESDSTDPKDTREIGVTVSVTPTVLPDDTIRMKLRPRTAQITEFIEGLPLQGLGRGNRYPRVAEATIETIARVPNGYSLLIGGFYNENKSDGDTKVPFLGDIPIINFFFKSKEKEKEQTSLVFIITPTAYNPMGATETLNVTDQLMDRLDIRMGNESINPNAPGPAHKPGMKRTLKAMLFDSFGNHQTEENLPLLQEGTAPQSGGYEQIPAKRPPPSAMRGPKLSTPPPAPKTNKATPER